MGSTFLTCCCNLGMLPLGTRSIISGDWLVEDRISKSFNITVLMSQVSYSERRQYVLLSVYTSSCLETRLCVSSSSPTVARKLLI